MFGKQVMVLIFCHLALKLYQISETLFYRQIKMYGSLLAVLKKVYSKYSYAFSSYDTQMVLIYLPSQSC